MNPGMLITQRELDEEFLNTAFITLREFATFINKTIEYNQRYSLNLSIQIVCEDMNKHSDFGKIILFMLTNESKDLIQWAKNL